MLWYNFVARADVCCENAQMESRCAGIHRHGIPRLLIVAKLALESSDFRAGSKPTGFKAIEDFALLIVANQWRSENEKIVSTTNRILR